MSDHSGMRYLFQQPNLISTQDRLFPTFSEFYFDIKYIKSRENSVAYALSRRVQVNHIITMSSYGKHIQEKILQARHIHSSNKKRIHSSHLINHIPYSFTRPKVLLLCFKLLDCLIFEHENIFATKCTEFLNRILLLGPPIIQTNQSYDQHTQHTY